MIQFAGLIEKQYVGRIGIQVAGTLIEYDIRG